MPFEFEKLEIDGLVLVKPRVLKDGRGFFMESYKLSDFKKAGIKEEFVQDNHSRSAKGTLRGLHFQKKPFAQAKLVRCVRGRIFDVAVDLRRRSKTFGSWLGVELSEKNGQLLYIPEGFAHGFLALEDGTEIIYKCSREYSKSHDAGVRWNDPEIGVKWGVMAPPLSEKDKNLPLLKDAEF